MHRDIETTAQIGKSISLKREKGSDDIERIIAHLKFSDAFVDREFVSAVCGLPLSWAHIALFDEQGAPLVWCEISLPRLSLSVTGKIRCNDGEGVTLTQAELDGITLTLCNQGAKLSGELSWEVAGDEASDTEDLLGNVCVLHAVIQDAQQGDLLKAA